MLYYFFAMGLFSEREKTNLSMPGKYNNNTHQAKPTCKHLDISAFTLGMLI